MKDFIMHLNYKISQLQKKDINKYICMYKQYTNTEDLLSH